MWSRRMAFILRRRKWPIPVSRAGSEQAIGQRTFARARLPRSARPAWRFLARGSSSAASGGLCCEQRGTNVHNLTDVQSRWFGTDR